MSYFTKGVKNPFQDPVRKPVIVKIYKPLPEELIKKLNYFASASSKKYNYKPNCEYPFENSPNAPQEEISEHFSSITCEVDQYHIDTTKIKDANYQRTREHVLRLNKDDKEIISIGNYVPPQQLYKNYYQNLAVINLYLKKRKMKHTSIDAPKTNVHLNQLYSRFQSLHHNTIQVKEFDDNEYTVHLNKATTSKSVHKIKKDSTNLSRFEEREFAYLYEKLSGHRYVKHRNLTTTLDVGSLHNISQKLVQLTEQANSNTSFRTKEKLPPIRKNKIYKDDMLKENISLSSLIRKGGADNFLKLRRHWQKKCEEKK